MVDARRLLEILETHDTDALRLVLDAGCDPNADLDGAPAIQRLVEMYLRSNRFAPCLRLMLDHGGRLADPHIAPVLLNDTDGIESALQDDPEWLRHRVSVPSAFTPLEDATLLHLACEYGHLEAARCLITHGADVDAPAGTDVFGFNGHTAIFHTVNSNANRSAPLMELLLVHGARVDRMLKGLWWGKGFEWETLLFDVTPISFAQSGLLPQFHRNEAQVYDNIRKLSEAAGRPFPEGLNVPNRYVAS